MDGRIVTIWKDGLGFRLIGNVYVQSNGGLTFEHTTLLTNADIASIFGERFLADLQLFVEWPVSVVIDSVIYVQATKEILKSLVDAREAFAMQLNDTRDVL